MSELGGRPEGSKNQPGHSAGGLRANSGRKRLDVVELESSDDEMDSPISVDLSGLPVDSGECILAILSASYILTLQTVGSSTPMVGSGPQHTLFPIFGSM
jgi:hypothetical protein